VTLTEDERAAVFDIPSQHAEKFLEKCSAPPAEEDDAAEGVSLITTLPALKARENEGAGNFTPGWGGGGGGRGGFGGRGRGDSRGRGSGDSRGRGGFSPGGGRGGGRGGFGGRGGGRGGRGRG
jgi:hypothetical protein